MSKKKMTYSIRFEQIGRQIRILSAFFITLILTALLSAGEQTQNFWQFNFDQPGRKTDLTDQGGSLCGTLPEGVSQNFLGWQKSSLKSEFRSEGKEKYYRFTVEKIDSSGPQMVIRIPEMTQGKYYRLTVTVRNSSEGRFGLYLRENPVPYTNIGPGISLESSNRWITESTVIRFTKPRSGSYSLYFNMSGCGCFDLKEIKIAETDYASYDAQQKGLAVKILSEIHRPDPKWNNYIFSSCFPFGVPAGWNCRRGAVSVSNDASGPSGQKALLLENGFGEIEQPRLYSAPFQVPDPQKIYSVSFSSKGKGFLVCNGKKFNLSDQWQRFETTVQIPEFQSGAVLDFSGDQKFLLDAVRVSEQGKTDYRRAGLCEIALGLPNSDASEARIQFSDEPSKLRYRLTGDCKDLSLAVSISNIWGKTKDLPRIVPDRNEGEIDYAVFPETPFGQFRVNVQAFRGSQEISPIAEYIVTRLKRPLYWGKDAPESPFGIHVEPIARMLIGLKAGGVNWVRLHDAGAQYSLWSNIEPEKGKWHFFDREIDCYRKHNLMIYGQLGGAPVWANYYGKGGPVTNSAYWIRYCSPTDEHMSDFENYAYRMVSHYKGIISDWCLWNEPWGSFLHKGYDPAKGGYVCFDNQGAQYTKILKAAYSGAKRADPKVKISGFGTTSGAENFTRQIVEAGGYASCDELDYHQYAPRIFGFPDDGMKDDLEKTFASVTKKYGPIHKEIIMSEGSPINSGSQGGSPLQGIYKNVLPWDNKEDVHDRADKIVRFLTAYQSCHVKRVFLYTAHGHTNLTKSAFLLLLSSDGYPHPMLAALSAFAQNAENAKFVRYQQLTEGVYAAVYEKKDGSGFVGIIGKRNGNIEIGCSDQSVKAADLYGNPLAFPVKYRGYVIYLSSPKCSQKILESLYCPSF